MELAEFLLEVEGNRNAFNVTRYACREKRTDIVSTLKTLRVDVHRKDPAVTDVEIVRMLLHHGVNIDARHVAGRTTLFRGI